MNNNNSVGQFPLPEGVVVVGVGGGLDEVEAGGSEAQLHGARVEPTAQHVVAAHLHKLR